jgi:hypothetical protein
LCFADRKKFRCIVKLSAVADIVATPHQACASSACSGYS